MRGITQSVVFLAWLAGCSNETGASQASFTGSYNASIIATIAIAGQNDSTTSTSTLIVTAGTGSDLVLDLDGCVIPAEVEGSTTFSVSGATCSDTEDGVMSSWTASGSGTVTSGNLTMNLSGTISLSGAGGTAQGTLSMVVTGQKL